MAKRHQHGIDLPTKLIRIQELIMARSGVDEFYEIIRIVCAKYFVERDLNITSLPDKKTCNKILNDNAHQIEEIFEGNLLIETPDDLFPEIINIIGDTSIIRQKFEAIDACFENLTARTYKSEKGQYFTPRHVIDMCVEVLQPKAGEYICDPACGSAAFLKASLDYMHGDKSLNLYGFDYSKRAYQVSKLLSILGADNGMNIFHADSLLPASFDKSEFLDGEVSIESVMEKELGSFEGFDMILTNPPFAGDIGGSEYINSYEVAQLYDNRIERDILFLERSLQLLKVGGRFAIVLPDNKISSNRFATLRNWLSQNSLIIGCVSLHRYAFLPHTSQKTAVLFGVKQEKSSKPYDTTVNLYRSDKPGKTSNGSPILLNADNQYLSAYESLDHDLKDIADDLKERFVNAKYKKAA